MKECFSFIDFFAGIGGIRIAFTNAGGKCVFSSEYDRYSQKTYKEYFGEQPAQKVEEPKEQELDEDTKSALELYKYLEENPHLIQAMRDVDVDGYKQLNTYVPDDFINKVQKKEE